MDMASPRDIPVWLRAIINIVAFIGVGATLMGWIYRPLGIGILIAAPVYFLWEIWPWLREKTSAYPRTAYTLFGCLIGCIIAACSLSVWHLFQVSSVPCLQVLIVPPLPPVVTFITRSGKSAGAKPLTADQEIKRRRVVLDKLRNDYIIQNPASSRDLLDGKADPPPQWINAQLKAIGETWRYEDRDHPFRLTAYQAMTNLELRDAALQLVSRIREWQAAHPEPETSPCQSREPGACQKVWADYSSQRETYQNAFMSTFLNDSRAVRSELEVRVTLPDPRPNEPFARVETMMAQSALNIGSLAGPDPIGTIANYIEHLAKALPTKAKQP